MSIRKSKHQQRISKRGHVRFEFDHHPKDGKRIIRTRVCHPNSVDAEYSKWLADIKQVQPAQVRKKFFEISKQFLASKSSEPVFRLKERQRVLDSFGAYVGNVSVDSIKKYMVIDFLATLTTYSPATKRKCRMLLSGFFTWCQDRELYTGVNPCSRIKDEPISTKHPRVSIDQIGEILDGVLGYTKTAVMLSLFAGLRIGEISTLLWSDIDFQSKHIIVRAENSKSGKQRMIPLADTLRDYLLSMRGIGRVVPRSIESIRLGFNTAKKTFSFDTSEFVFHSLRHLFALKCAAAGVPMEVISEWLGHANLLITQKFYAQSVEAEKGHKEIALLDKMIARNS